MSELFSLYVMDLCTCKYICILCVYVYTFPTRRLNNEDLQNLYLWPNIMRVIKLRTVGLVRNVVSILDMKR